MKSVLRVIPSKQSLEGAGFPVQRPFPVPGLSHLDPFLLLDQMGPHTSGPGEAKGAPDHPHRGFETVTYLISGEMEHKDSHGNHGVIRPGGVQWMTAGNGVIHSEMPSKEFQKTGGSMHGFQLWVNLPSTLKLAHPRYQDLNPKDIPSWKSADGLTEAKVISGSVGGVSSKIETHIPLTYLHVILQPGGTFEANLPASEQTLIYTFQGSTQVNDRRSYEGDLTVFGMDGESVRLSSEKGAQALVLSGAPTNEPVVRYGPFVMNTIDEVRKAFDDYSNGTFGEIRI